MSFRKSVNYSVVDDFVMKVCGSSDYIYGADVRMIDFSFIRKALLKENKINLSLIYFKDSAVTKAILIEEVRVIPSWFHFNNVSLDRLKTLA